MKAVNYLADGAQVRKHLKVKTDLHKMGLRNEPHEMWTFVNFFKNSI